jgi:hypothetical protein
MSRTHVGFALVVALGVVSAAGPVFIYRQGQLRWPERARLLEEQSLQIAELSAENQRLSTLVAQAESSSLSGDQIRELMRLRGEIGRLRQSAREAARILTNEPSLGESSRSNLDGRSGPFDPSTVQAYWSKDQLTVAGYGDPISSLQTTLWAMARNDPKMLVDTLAPEQRAELVNHAQMNGGSEAERIAAQGKLISDSLTCANGFYVGQDIGPQIKDLNPSLHVFDVYFAGEDATRAFALQRIGDEWKLHSILVREGTESAPMLGPTLWP